MSNTFRGMKEGHLKVGDIVRLGWPAAMGDGLWLVLEVRNPSTINDIRVIRSDLQGESWYTRSLGAVRVSKV